MLPWLNKNVISLIYICRYSRYFDSGVSQLSIGAQSHREARKGFIDPRENYFKFLVARHPLERLGSAFSYMSRNVQDVKELTPIRPAYRKAYAKKGRSCLLNTGRNKTHVEKLFSMLRGRFILSITRH